MRRHARHRPAAPAPQVGPRHRLPRGRPHRRRRRHHHPTPCPGSGQTIGSATPSCNCSSARATTGWWRRLTRGALGSSPRCCSVAGPAPLRRRQSRWVRAGRNRAGYFADPRPGERAAPLLARGPPGDHAARRHRQRWGGPASRSDDALGVGEGVATSFAAYQLFGVPTWAALSANGDQGLRAAARHSPAGHLRRQRRELRRPGRRLRPGPPPQQSTGSASSAPSTCRPKPTPTGATCCSTGA